MIFSRPTQVQFFVMKQNSCPVDSAIAKPTGVGLDEWDGAVEALGAGTADVVLAEVEQSRLMAPEHLDNFLDRFELTAHGVVAPSNEEAFGITFVMPEEFC